MGARRTWLALAFVIFVAAPALAQGTGGRMGGGSWGRSSSSSSSSSSSGSYRSSSSSSSSRSSSSSWGGGYHSSPSSNYHYSGGGGGGGLSPGFLFVLLIGGGAVAVVWFLAQAASNRSPSMSFVPTFYPSGDDGGFNSVDVSVLRVAIDGRARKFVQTELARIAKSADTATDEGRATMLREVSLMLRRVRDAWVYGGAVNEPMRAMETAKATFDKHVDDARGRFDVETVSNVQGKTATAVAPEHTPRSEEGAGLILVTLVVAARSELFTVRRIGDGEELRKALEAAAHRTDLIAIECVWQPSEDADRLSSVELEAKYPRPDLIPIEGALVGKIFCGYCSGPYPAELVSCPHCGAPRDTDLPRAA